jgi:hypothetical protein
LKKHKPRFDEGETQSEGVSEGGPEENGLKKDGVMGEWRKLHKKGLCDLYSSIIIRMIKLRMRWVWHVA